MAGNGRRLDMATLAGKPPMQVKAGPPRTVPLDQVAHNPFNPRESLTGVEELAAILREKGQLQPASVMTRTAFLAANPGAADLLSPRALFVVIEGNRRLAAARVAALPEFKIDVNDGVGGTPEEILESALVANVHRENLTPMEEARSIQQLLAHYGPRSGAAVARKLGKSEGWISQRIALLGLTPELQEEVDSKALPVKEARRIGRLAPRQQVQAAEVVKAQAAAGKAAGPAAVARPKDANLYPVKVEPEQPSAGGVPVPREAAAEPAPEANLYPVKVEPVPEQQQSSAGGAGSRVVDLVAMDVDALADEICSVLATEQAIQLAHALADRIRVLQG